MANKHESETPAAVGGAAPCSANRVSVWSHPCWLQKLVTLGTMTGDREQAESLMGALSVGSNPKLEDLRHHYCSMTNEELGKLGDVDDYC